MTSSSVAWAKEQALSLSGQIGKNETISKIHKGQGGTQHALASGLHLLIKALALPSKPAHTAEFSHSRRTGMDRLCTLQCLQRGFCVKTGLDRQNGLLPLYLQMHIHCRYL